MNRASPPSVATARSSRDERENSRFAEAKQSGDERVLEVDGGIHTMVLHTTTPTTPEHVETQTVLRGVDEIQEIKAEPRPLLPSDLTLKDRVLDALAEVQTLSGHPSEATPTLPAGGGHVVGHENHQGVISSGTGGIRPGPPSGDVLGDGLGDAGGVQPSSAPEEADG